MITSGPGYSAFSAPDNRDSFGYFNDDYPVASSSAIDLESQTNNPFSDDASNASSSAIAMGSPSDPFGDDTGLVGSRSYMSGIDIGNGSFFAGPVGNPDNGEREPNVLDD